MLAACALEGTKARMTAREVDKDYTSQGNSDFSNKEFCPALLFLFTISLIQKPSDEDRRVYFPQVNFTKQFKLENMNLYIFLLLSILLEKPSAAP